MNGVRTTPASQNTGRDCEWPNHTKTSFAESSVTKSLQGLAYLPGTLSTDNVECDHHFSRKLELSSRCGRSVPVHVDVNEMCSGFLSRVASVPSGCFDTRKARPASALCTGCPIVTGPFSPLPQFLSRSYGVGVNQAEWWPNASTLHLLTSRIILLCCALCGMR